MISVMSEGSGKPVDHGGSLARARALFPGAPEPWVDLSTGISPHPYPFSPPAATAFTRLPEPGRERDLRHAAARAYGAPAADHVVAAPGTQILLPMIAALAPKGRAAVLSPTYAEHARAAATAGFVVDAVGDPADLAGAELAIVVNPNNPDGRLLPRHDLLRMRDRLQHRGGLLVVDEAFMDASDAADSVAGDVGQGGLVVLRSFGKFHGLAGIRLGFAITGERTAADLRAKLGPWAVSGPALEIGIEALSDDDWRAAARRRLDADASRLDGLLAARDIAVAGGTSLFRFVRFSDAPRIFSTLGRAGIIIRHFAERPHDLRIGLPGTEDEWRRLDQALAGWRRVAA